MSVESPPLVGVEAIVEAIVDVGRALRDPRQPIAPVPRIALQPDEAAAALGVSRDYFDEHIRPELRVIRRGRRVLFAVTELQRWLDTNAARTLP